MFDIIEDKYEEWVKTIDLVEGTCIVDLNSIHPKRLQILVDKGYVEKTGLGNNKIYILSIKGEEVLGG